MNKFWLVWCQQGGTPTYKHDSHELACNEAERLARENPGKRFDVLERITSVVKQDVLWEGDMPKDWTPF